MLGFESQSPLFQTDDRASWSQALVQRARIRLNEMTESNLQQMLEETLYYERQRLDRHGSDDKEVERADRLSKALVRSHSQEQKNAALAMVDAWADEIQPRHPPLSLIHI